MLKGLSTVECKFYKANTHLTHFPTLCDLNSQTYHTTCKSVLNKFNICSRFCSNEYNSKLACDIKIFI